MINEVCLITYRTTKAKRAEYARAAAKLGTDTTKIIRQALEAALLEAERGTTGTTSSTSPESSDIPDEPR